MNVLQVNADELFFDVEPSQTMPGYVEVILPLAIPKTFTYSIPANLNNKVKEGCRAEVVFGKNKKYAGIIKSISKENPGYEVRDIIQVIDEEPIIFEQQLQLWNWISKYYMCSEGEVMSAALPTHLKLSSETTLFFNEEYGDDFSDLGNDEYLIAEALLLKNELSISQVQQLLDVRQVYPVIKKLIDKKVCFAYEHVEDKYKVKTENFVLLNPSYTNDDALSDLLNNWSKAPKQLELLLSYLHLVKTEGDVTQIALLKKASASAAQLKGLIDKSILSIQKRSVNRLPSLPKDISIDFVLSDAQQKSLEHILEIFQDKNVCLLHGVTSSGKTLVYIKLIEKIIASGKQVLYLLPEITLTAQIIRRLQKYFGGNVSIYHSKFNNNERVEVWNKIKSGEVKIILGARSALFLPFNNLGLIIIDEEHDSSFKQQDPAPRYNARDAAVFYASLFKAKVVLGSATPSLESYYNAAIGKFGLALINERFGNIDLPQIETINTRQVAASKKGKVTISPQLKSAIEETVANDRQVILFQNRRGYAPFLFCATCGFVPHCNNCDVTLTLHKFSNRLHCHYCGTSYPKLTTCPACGSVNWLEKNFGTEKIEEELDTDFPDLRIARMDVDAVKGKHAHENLIHIFEKHELDILVGTQMVVKGLDFEKVALVGILDADGLLSFADFRANERAFQLMEQVSGRAGRKLEQGKVLIQSGKPDHPVIALVQQHDYINFFNYELDNRKQFNYPPYSRVIKLIAKHRINEVVTEAADVLYLSLAKTMKDFIIGPAAPVVNRIRSLYLREILIKLPRDTLNLNGYKNVISGCINLLHVQKPFRSVTVIIDVDPL
ncbi:MAG: primosomal protein N' [Ginsengibacter sp.]